VFLGFTVARRKDPAKFVMDAEIDVVDEEARPTSPGRACSSSRQPC